MITIRELKGWPHSFNLADGRSLRLWPRTETELPESAISEEIKSAARKGYVALISTTPEAQAAEEKEKREAEIQEKPAKKVLIKSNKEREE